MQTIFSQKKQQSATSKDPPEQQESNQPMISVQGENQPSSKGEQKEKSDLSEREADAQNNDSEARFQTERVEIVQNDSAAKEEHQQQEFQEIQFSDKKQGEVTPDPRERQASKSPNSFEEKLGRFQKRKAEVVGEDSQYSDELKTGQFAPRKSKLIVQNKLVQKNQQAMMQEIEEKLNESKRDEILELIKTKLSFKGIHPFDLFISFDDAQIDYQIRPFEFEMALNQIDVLLDRKAQAIIMKYFKVPDAEQIATLKLCWSLVDDVGELVLMAFNYIINKYRMLFEIVFDEITGPDKMVTIDVLQKLNQEFNWNIEEEKIQKAYHLLTDFGNSFLDFFKFKRKLDGVTQQQDSKFNAQSYKLLQLAIIETGKHKLDQIKSYLAEQDQAQQGEIGQFAFYDLLAMYFNRALSKQEIMAINVYLQKPNEEGTIVYHKLITETQKTLDELLQQQYGMEATKKRNQDEVITQFLSFVIDQETEIHAQYFKGVTAFTIDRETFIKETIKITGYQLDAEKADKVYEYLVQNKPKNQEGSINIHEFKSFLDPYLKHGGDQKKPDQVKSLKTDVYVLFDQLDSHKIRSLTQNQLFHGLLKIGLLVPIKDVTAMKSFDFGSFQKIVLRLLSQTCYNPKKTIYQIKREYELIKETYDDKIGMTVMKQVFDTLNVNLSFEDIIYFYQILDQERTGFIKLSDFLHLIHTHSQMDFRLNELIFKIKGYKDFPISTMHKLFNQLPDNFVRPFTDKAHLVSRSLGFRPDFEGNVLNNLLDKNSNSKLFKIKITSAVGIPWPQVPKPDPKQLKLEKQAAKEAKKKAEQEEKQAKKKKEEEEKAAKEARRLEEEALKKAGKKDPKKDAKKDLKKDAKQQEPSSKQDQKKDGKQQELKQDQKQNEDQKKKEAPAPVDPSKEQKEPFTVFRRECVVAIYDKFYKKFIENSITIKAKWNPKTPDVWQLQDDFNPLGKVMFSYQRNRGFLLNCDTVKYHKELFLIFEFVAYIRFKDHNQPVKVSCGFAEISFEQILYEPPKNLILEIAFQRYGYNERTLLIQGGTPEQVIAINPKDVKPGHKGNNPVVSQMVISIEKRSRRKTLLQEGELLPKFCLLDRNMMQIVYAYRKYGKDKMEATIDVRNNPKMKIFLYCLDNPYVCNKMCRFWSKYMRGRLLGQEMKGFELLVGQLIKLTKMKDFNFNPYTPNEIFFQEQCKEKKKVVTSVLLYALYLFDLNFNMQLGLDGNVILDEQLKLYGQIIQQDLFDSKNDLFDQYYNGLNLEAYQEFQQI